MMYQTIRAILFRFDAEKVHDIATVFGRAIAATPLRRVLKAVYTYSHPALRTKVAGITFENPIGLGAGFDKNAFLIDVISSLGFGHEEVGSITYEASAGNPKPRLWRLPKDKSIVVNYGLANEGADIVKYRLKRSYDIPIGVSVARTNKPMTEEESIKDYVCGFEILHSCGDYTAINVSCPNVANRQPFCHPNKLSKLLKEINRCRILEKPIFLKLKPDMSKKDIDGVLQVVEEYNWISGFILTNLSESRKGLKSSDDDLAKVGAGSLSGLPIQKGSDAMIKYIYKKTKGKYVLIGLGGVFTAEDAYRKIRNGASLVQLITGLIYEGPGVVKQINKGLVKLLKRDGFKQVSEAVGVDA